MVKKGAKQIVVIVICFSLLMSLVAGQLDPSVGWHPFDQLSADDLATIPLTDYIQLDPSGNREVNVSGDFYVLGNDLYGKDSLRFRTEGSPWAMIIDNAGDIGMGISPDTGFHIHDTQQWITANADYASLWFAADYDATPNWAGIGMKNDGSLRLTGGGSLDTPSVVITDAGKMAVGRDNPTHHFEVYDAAMDMTVTQYGIYNYHDKETGSSDEADDLHGIYSDTRMNHPGGTIGHLRGANIFARLVDGNIGTSGSGEDLVGLRAQAELQSTADTVDDNVYGAYVHSLMDGGVVNDNVYAGYFLTNLDAGTAGNAATDKVYGLYAFADLEPGTSVSGDVFGLYVNVDDDSNNNAGSAGTTYSLYVDNQDNTDYGIYQEGTGILNWFGSPIVAADFSCTDCINAGDLAANSVGSSEIASGAVESDDIATNTIEAVDINTNAVNHDEIAENAVRASEINADAVGASELVSSYESGSAYDARFINVGESGDSIQDNTIDDTELAPNSVGNSELIDDILVETIEANNGVSVPDFSPGTVIQGATSTLNNYAIRIKNARNHAGAWVMKLTGGTNVWGGNEVRMITFSDGDGGIMGHIYGANYVGNLHFTGRAAGVYSDRRLKENIEDYSDDALALVTSLQPVTYTYINDSYGGYQTRVGFIAQDMLEVYPQAVNWGQDLRSYTEEDLPQLHFDYGELTPVLAKAIQQQQEQIEKLTAVVCEDRPEHELCNELD